MNQNDNYYINNNESPEINERKYISRYSGIHKANQKKLLRKIRKTKRMIMLCAALSKFAMFIFLVFSIYTILNLKYWKLNPMAFSSLKNNSIKIENNYIAPSDKILRALQQNPIEDKPIFLMDVEPLKESILKIPPIEKVYIKRFWFPARIEVLVQEREPAITIAPNENVPPIAFYTKDGKLIGRAYMPLNPMFKTVKVLTYGIYSGTGQMDSEKIKFIMTIANDIEEASKEPVQYIDFRNPDDVYAQIPTVKLKLGAVSPATYPDTLKKINGLPAILPQIKILNKKVKYLDLRWQNNLFFIKLDDE